MKYAWIQKHSKSKDGWPISMLCEQLGVSISGYHQHERSGATNKPSTVVDGGKRINNDVLLTHIKAIHAQVKGDCNSKYIVCMHTSHKHHLLRIKQLRLVEKRSKYRFEGVICQYLLGQLM
jgi:hypothetical protein